MSQTRLIRIDTLDSSGKTVCQDFNLLALFEAVRSPVFVLKDRRILYANNAFAKLTRQSTENLLDIAIDEIFHPEDIVQYQSMLFDEETENRPTLRVLCKGESDRQVDVRTTPIEFDGVELTVCFIYDLTERLAANRRHKTLIRFLSQILNGDPVPTFVINAKHEVTHWNTACEIVTGTKAAEIVGTKLQWKPFYPAQRPALADVVVDQSMETIGRQLYGDKLAPSPTIPGAYEVTAFFPHFGEEGRWLYFTAAPLRDETGQIIGAIETLQDATERHLAELALKQHQVELERLLGERTTALEATSAQLVQSEKLASIGQLAAGVAHEINNPIGYVHSNISSLENYITDLFKLLDAYEQSSESLPTETRESLATLRQKLDIAFLKEDIPQLVSESREGIIRVKQIIQNLKDFSRVDCDHDWQWADIHQGIESTLNIVNNEIKYKADVVKNFDVLPQVRCRLPQLNQVFMNVLVNAAQAMGAQRGTITIRTRRVGDNHISIEIADTGSGIPPTLISRIFDPFFTTKPVGTGTGLGLSLSYGIIQSHGGRIEVQSAQGEGTCFVITLPIEPSDEVTQA